MKNQISLILVLSCILVASQSSISFATITQLPGNQGCDHTVEDGNTCNEKGDKGDQGLKGEKGDTASESKTKTVFEFEGVIAEGSRNAFSTFYNYDVNNGGNTVGLKWKHYFGKSYADQVREDLQKQIDELKKNK